MEKNILREANILFYKEDFDGALALYKQAQKVFSELYDSLELIIDYTEHQRSKRVVSKVSQKTINKDRFGNTIKEKIVIKKK